MKALSLTQPWATLIAIGAKRIETRSWSTSYRGPVAIHAAKAMPAWARDFAFADPAGPALAAAGILLDDDCTALPRGAIVAVARLTDVVPTEQITAMSQGLLRHEIDFGDYAPGRYAWVLADVVALKAPVRCKGALGLWAVADDIARSLKSEAIA